MRAAVLTFALLVSSAAHSEDKSIVLANLAVTFAQAGNKTILVDSDLRRPAQHEIWGLPSSAASVAASTGGASNSR